MQLTPELWRRAVILYREFERRGEKLSRSKLAEALHITEALARGVIFALENQSIIKFEPRRFEVARRELILADLHIPYHDPLAVEAALSFGDRFHPDLIVILGDLIDMYDISPFIRRPRNFNLRQELEKARQFLEDLRARFPTTKIIVVEGNHECVSADTEILTKEGWKRADEITLDDEIAQFDMETREVIFGKPKMVHRFFADRWANVKTYQGWEQITLEHSLIIEGRRVKVKDILSQGLKFNQTQLYFAGYLAEKYRQNVNLPDDWLRLLTWVIMDGTIVVGQGNKVRIQLKLSKPRKIKRLKWILDNLGLKYTFRKATKSPTNKLQPYYIRIYGEPARQIKQLLDGEKRFPKEWVLGLSKRQVDIILEEIKNTDGRLHYNHIVWISTDKHNVDVIQTACILNGYPFKYSYGENRSGFKKRGSKPQYICSIYPNGLVSSWGKITVKMGLYRRFVAIETEKSTLITRFNGRVNFTGNSRAERYILKNAEKLWDLLEGFVPQRLGVEQINAEYIDKPFQVGALWHLHGHEKMRGGNPEYITNVIWKNIHDHFIVGHWHPEQQKIFKRIDGATFWGGAVGHLSDPAKAEYAKVNNWTQGFATVEFDDSGHFRARLHRIENGEIY